MSSARFRVDPRLASLLGENYRSTERALKELVDNAWDADAKNVWINIPVAVSDQPIVICDDGTGMTEREVRNEYLSIASDRRTRKGNMTPLHKRRVKGRKGIGKFAGLVAASTMSVETSVRGVTTLLEIAKVAIMKAAKDLEQVDLPIQTRECAADYHGTVVTLTDLNQRLARPDADAMKELLVLDYGREQEFAIYVNDEKLGLADIPGQMFTFDEEFADAGKVKLDLKIMENGRPLTKAGIIMRVDGKVVGSPSFFGLDEREDIPKKLLNRICGEISADGLIGDVTADWGALIENSKGLRSVQDWVGSIVHREIETVFSKDIEGAQAQLDRKIKERIKNMPEYRRQFAEEALHRLMRKFFDISVAMRDTLVSLVLDAIERDEYGQVCKQIEEARHGDIMNLADALNSFGIVTITALAYQAHSRLTMLNALDGMVVDSKTTELEVHKALENNLWVLGTDCSLMSSNETLKTTIERYTAEQFKGDRANKRPDLLLAQDGPDRMLLIEFKRPSITLNRDHQRQAKEYRDALVPYFKSTTIAILIVGGKIDPSIASAIDGDTRFCSYSETINKARIQFDWLLRELTCNS